MGLSTFYGVIKDDGVHKICGQIRYSSLLMRTKETTKINDSPNLTINNEYIKFIFLCLQILKKLNLCNTVD